MSPVSLKDISDNGNTNNDATRRSSRQKKTMSHSDNESNPESLFDDPYAEDITIDSGTRKSVECSWVSQKRNRILKIDDELSRQLKNPRR